MRDDNYGSRRDGRKSSSTCIWYVLGGLFAFIFLYYPFFGGKARFVTGTFMANIFRSIISVANYISLMSFIFGLFLLCMHNFRTGIQLMVIGIVIYYIANVILVG